MNVGVYEMGGFLDLTGTKKMWCQSVNFCRIYITFSGNDRISEEIVRLNLLRRVNWYLKILFLTSQVF